MAEQHPEQHPYGEVVFKEAQRVMAALSADLLGCLDPTDLLLAGDLQAQQAITVAGFVLLKTVILDFTGEAPGPYLADLGLRVARRIEKLES